MSKVIHKRDIARSFGNAAETYDSVATLQRRVGNKLLAFVQQKLVGANGLRVLDLGTGTGFFLPALREGLDCESLYACDLSEGMLHYAHTHHSPSVDAFIVGDAECLPFSENHFDLVFSSLALQWCSDLPRLFEELARVVAPGGLIAFSTLLDGTLHELKSSWSKADTVSSANVEAQHVNEFFSLADYERAAESVPSICASWSTDEEVLWYDKAMDLMRELKALGAHNMASDRSKGLTGKRRLLRFIDAYETYRSTDDKLPATYACCYGMLSVR